MATWCVGTGFPPSVYLSLTRNQRSEFARAANRMNGGG